MANVVERSQGVFRDLGTSAGLAWGVLACPKVSEAVFQGALGDSIWNASGSFVSFFEQVNARFPGTPLGPHFGLEFIAN